MCPTGAFSVTRSAGCHIRSNRPNGRLLESLLRMRWTRTPPRHHRAKEGWRLAAYFAGLGFSSCRRRGIVNQRPGYVRAAVPLASKSWPCPAILGDAVQIWSRRPNASILAQTHEILWEMPPWRAPPGKPLQLAMKKYIAKFRESLPQSIRKTKPLQKTPLSGATRGGVGRVPGFLTAAEALMSILVLGKFLSARCDSEPQNSKG
jgi:hypothetical protein